MSAPLDLNAVRCPRCGSEQRVSVSFTGGATRGNQCVPCGATYGPWVVNR